MNMTYGTGYFAKWLFSQREAWLSSDGQWWTLEEGHENTMNPHHALSTILMLERTAVTIYHSRFGYEPTDAQVASKWLVATPLYTALKSFITARLG